MNNLSEKDITPLITLLQDDNESVVETVAAHLVTIGTLAVPHLQRAREAQPMLLHRIAPVLEAILRKDMENAFFTLSEEEDNNTSLERGAFLIAQFGSPNINIPEYVKKIDSMAEAAQQEINQKASGEDIIRAFNHYFFTKQGFCGNTTSYNEVENSFLDKIIDRKTGIPIGLSVLYILIGSRLNLPLYGVGTPGHFLVKYSTKDYKVFIDCFNAGALLTDKDCARFLIRNGYGFKAKYLHPIPIHLILTRMLRNLSSLYKNDNDTIKATQLNRFIDLLRKTSLRR